MRALPSDQQFVAVGDPKEPTHITARVRSGRMILLESQEDVERVETHLLSLMRQAPERELDSLYDSALQIPNLLADNPVDRDEPNGDDRVGFFDTERPPNEIQTMVASMRVMRRVWGSSVDPGALRIAVSVLPKRAPPGGGSDQLVLQFSDIVPHLTLKYGSLISTFTNTNRILTGGRWAITLYSHIRGTFVTANEASQWLVEELRNAATGRYPLPRLDKLATVDEAAIATAKRVVILVHGFLATDLGTFDGFVESWQMRKERRPGLFRFFRREQQDQEVLFIGWPHNSMASIDFNGERLAELIAMHLGKTQCSIVFVCHSRGGLVARSAYCHLRTQHAYVSSWRKRIAGLMTFGTPHGGLMYRISFGAISTIALHGLASKTIVSVDRSLIYLYHRGRFAGIEDLQNPKDDDETFFSRLDARERRHGRLPLIAYGGSVDHRIARGDFFTWAYFASLLSTIRDAIDRGEGHDLIFRTSTTLPDWAHLKRIVPRHHSDYFRPGKALDKAMEDLARLFSQGVTQPEEKIAVLQEPVG
jgi:hypothetical protein